MRLNFNPNHRQRLRICGFCGVPTSLIGRKDRLLYDWYIKSDIWKSKREWALNLLGRQCSVCGNRIGLEVHHLTYDHMGYELIGDLLVLCRDCHEAQHER